jgi:hypothetical protein
MAPDSAAKLRLLAAETRAERSRIDRTVAELTAAVAAGDRLDSTRLHLYGAVALLETFYGGVEKALLPIAAASASVPDGSAWHRRLLDDSTLDLPQIRPPFFRNPLRGRSSPSWPFAIASAIFTFSIWMPALYCRCAKTLQRLGRLQRREESGPHVEMSFGTFKAGPERYARRLDSGICGARVHVWPRCGSGWR